MYYVHGKVERSFLDKDLKSLTLILESLVNPTIELGAKYVEDGVALAGGMFARDSNESVMIIEAESNEELRRILEGSPIWNVTSFQVTPLERYDDRLKSTRKMFERLKALAGQ